MGWCELFAVRKNTCTTLPVSIRTSNLVSSPEADLESVGKEGTPSQEYERTTWPELAKLAQDHPEAGIHFQGMQRSKVWT